MGSPASSSRVATVRLKVCGVAQANPASSSTPRKTRATLRRSRGLAEARSPGEAKTRPARPALAALSRILSASHSGRTRLRTELSDLVPRTRTLPAARSRSSHRCSNASEMRTPVPASHQTISATSSRWAASLLSAMLRTRSRSALVRARFVSRSRSLDSLRLRGTNISHGVEGKHPVADRKAENVRQDRPGGPRRRRPAVVRNSPEEALQHVDTVHFTQGEVSDRTLGNVSGKRSGVLELRVLRQATVCTRNLCQPERPSLGNCHIGAHLSGRSRGFTIDQCLFQQGFGP